MGAVAVMMQLTLSITSNGQRLVRGRRLACGEIESRTGLRSVCAVPSENVGDW